MNPSTNVLQTAVMPYPLYSGGEVQSQGVIGTVIASMHQAPTVFNTRFFNRSNLDVLQRSIASVVKQRTGMLIDRQSDDQLLIAMRAIYLENEPVNVAVGIDDAVRQLNQQVVDNLVPTLTSNLMQYLGYLRDASTLPDVMPLPQATSIKGEKGLNLAKQML